MRAYPITGIFLIAVFLAVSGVPPFGTFISELIILYAAIAGHHYFVAFFYCLFLALIFIGIADIILKMSQGQPLDEGVGQTPKESWSMIVPILILIVIVVDTWFLYSAILEQYFTKRCRSFRGIIKLWNCLMEVT